MYHLVRDHLPTPELYMIRDHSFDAWHREREYGTPTNDEDRAMLRF